MNPRFSAPTSLSDSAFPSKKLALSPGNSSGLNPRFSAPTSLSDSVLPEKKLALSSPAAGAVYALNTLTDGGGSSVEAGARVPSKLPKKSAGGSAGGAAATPSDEAGASSTSSTDFIDRPPSTCLPAGFLILLASFWASSSALSATAVGGLRTTGSSFVICIGIFDT